MTETQGLQPMETEEKATRLRPSYKRDQTMTRTGHRDRRTSRMKQSKVMALGTQMGSDATTLNPNFPLPSRWLLSMASSYGYGQYIKGGTEKGGM